MPRISRRRRIAASPDQVWALVSDPYNLPRWWPRTIRVESVNRKSAGRRSEWTKVLETSEGRGVRADFRCTSSAEKERYVWEQQLAGTPFERHLRRSAVEVRLHAQKDETEVTLTSDQRMKGLSRLGSPMMRRAQGAILDDALAGIERALSGEPV
ncbi:MAG TPA: SRPBCC family protein [Solirubrobacterales bacterium]|nr:SRPBCC family protein [Solirubrobacterales bacterium]